MIHLAVLVLFTEHRTSKVSYLEFSRRPWFKAHISAIGGKFSNVAEKTRRRR